MMYAWTVQLPYQYPWKPIQREPIQRELVQRKSIPNVNITDYRLLRFIRVILGLVT